MKLQIFDCINSRKHGGGRPSVRTISIYGSNGSVTFSAKTCEDLNIKEGNKVFFAKDTESRKDWYFCISQNLECGIPIRKKLNGGLAKDKPSLSCSCRVVVDSILADYKAEKSALFLVSAKGKTINGMAWYQIINKPLRIDSKNVNE